jgi:hypothetical protein
MTKRKVMDESGQGASVGMAPDEFEDARTAVAAWERETEGERWTVKRMTVAALFALLWALLVEVRALRWQQGRE